MATYIDTTIIFTANPRSILLTILFSAFVNNYIIILNIDYIYLYIYLRRRISLTKSTQLNQRNLTHNLTH